MVCGNNLPWQSIDHFQMVEIDVPSALLLTPVILLVRWHMAELLPAEQLPAIVYDVAVYVNTERMTAIRGPRVSVRHTGQPHHPR